MSSIQYFQGIESGLEVFYPISFKNSPDSEKRQVTFCHHIVEPTGISRLSRSKCVICDFIGDLEIRVSVESMNAIQ